MTVGERQAVRILAWAIFYLLGIGVLLGHAVAEFRPHPPPPPPALSGPVCYNPAVCGWN
jgi:hypothetical protein